MIEKTKELSQFIDHTLLKPTANQQDFLTLCHEAKEFEFKAVCIPPTWVSFCKEQLIGTNVLTAAVVGFPLGYSFTETKLNEIKLLSSFKTDEIDFVVNLSWVKSNQFDKIHDEFKALRDASENIVLKAILETAALTESEIKRLCDIAMETKHDFVKTSTGFYGEGARLEDVKLMKKHVGESISIKASGGIKNLDSALQFINAGANRIGCSASVSILKELRGNNTL